MKIGVVSDIHSNLEALNSVLDDMPTVDIKICCGDIVGYNSKPKKCLDIVRDEFNIIVQGNHDREVSNNKDLYYMSRDYSRRKLSEKDLLWLSNLPVRKKFKNILVVHSHPSSVDKYVKPRDFPKMTRYINKEEVLLLGHTHKSHHYKNNNKLILNPGSVGQPRDGDPRASYAIIDNESMSVDIRRVPYDINKVKEEIKELGFPSDNYKRLFEGR